MNLKFHMVHLENILSYDTLTEYDIKVQYRKNGH